MKVFKYRFTKLTILLIYSGIALCVAGVGINLYVVLTKNLSEAANVVYPIVQYSLTFLIPSVMLILLVSLIFSSYYSIDGKTLKISFGLIKSKYDVKEITTVMLDRTVDKLSVYLSDNTVFAVVIKEECYRDFIDALCKTNPLIEYTINSKENDIDKDDKKK